MALLLQHCSADISIYCYVSRCFFYHHIHQRLCPKTRRTLFLLKLGAFQFAVLKIAFTILSIVLYTNDLFDVSDVSPVTLSLPLTFHFVCLFDLFNISEISELTIHENFFILLSYFYHYTECHKGIKQTWQIYTSHAHLLKSFFFLRKVIDGTLIRTGVANTRQFQFSSISQC